MKRLMVTLAGVAALIASASADVTVNSWFTTGIKDYTTWPGTETTGAWQNTDGGALTGEDGAKKIALDADDATPLKFQANVSKTIGDTTASVSVKSKLSFTPFAESAVASMEVPSDAKGGVIVVKDAEENLKYYVLAKDTEATDPITNKWTATGITASSDAVEVTITVTKGSASGVEKVTYKFGDTTSGTYDLVMSGEITAANYSGCGTIETLSADETPAAFDLKFESVPEGVQGVVVTVDGQSVTAEGNVYKIENGKTAVMAFTPAAGYMLKQATASVTPTANVTYTSSDFPVTPNLIIAKIGDTPYASFDEALTAAVSGNTITFCQNVTLTETLTLNKGAGTTLTFDLAGKEWTTAATTISSGTVKLVNTAAPTGFFAPNGVTTIATGATLDFSEIKFSKAYGGVEGTGSLTIANGATAIFYAWGGESDSANWMFGNNAPFFTGSVIPNGGIVKIGDKTWTGDSVADRFKIAGEVAVAEITGTHIPAADPATFGFVESYASLADAVAAVDENCTVALMAAGSLASTAKPMKIDLGGYALTITGDTLNYNLTITDSDTQAGGSLVCSGNIAVNAKLDLSELTSAQIAGVTGAFAIGAAGEVSLPVSQTARELAAAGKFAGSVAGAKVTTQAGYAVYDGKVWLTSGVHPWNGDGSVANPYQIATKADLLLLRDYTKEKKFLGSETNFIQMADISLDGEAWTGIGPWVGGTKPDGSNTTEKVYMTSDMFFHGTYDGNNKKITSVQFSSTATATPVYHPEYMGFFNGLQGATIKNLEIDTIGFANHGEGDFGVGVLTSMAAESTIRNVTIGGLIDNATHNCAGFAIKGYSTTFEDCVNNASITSAAKRVAGFVGFESSMNGKRPLTFIRCTNNGDLRVGLTNDTADYGCGGFIGGLCTENIAFTNCVSNGKTETTGLNNKRAGSFIGAFNPTANVKIFADGCSAKYGDMPSIGFIVKDVSKLIVDSLAFATTNESGVASFAMPTFDGTVYNVMASNQTSFVLTAADQTLKLDTAIAGYVGSVTVSISGYKSAAKATTEGTVTTYVPEAESSGPQPGSGSAVAVEPVEGKENTYAVTATSDNGAVLLSGVKSGDTLEMYGTNITSISSDSSLEGVTFAVKSCDGKTVINSGAFVGLSADSKTFTATLNADAKVTLEIGGVEKEIPVTPTIGDGLVSDPFTVGDDVSTKIAAIPGLTYSLVRSDKLGTGKTETSVDSETATATTLTLTDESVEKPSQAFYVIEVTK